MGVSPVPTLSDAIDARQAIEETVHRETRASDRQDVDLLLSIFHEGMGCRGPLPPVRGP